jgi:hypothetical protein
MQIKQLKSLLLAAGVALPGAAIASGTYTARPPRPPIKAAQGEKMDSAKYDLGKRIYNGKAKLDTASGTPMAAQETKLSALEARLPEKERKSAHLTSYAGKLTAEQLDALDYYVAHRFPQK